MESKKEAQIMMDTSTEAPIFHSRGFTGFASGFRKSKNPTPPECQEKRIAKRRAKNKRARIARKINRK